MRKAAAHPPGCARYGAGAGCSATKYQSLFPFRHSLRAICTVLLDPRDPLLHSERTQGFAADPVYVKGEVFAYVGLPQNLKDLKDLCVVRGGVSELKSLSGI